MPNVPCMPPILFVCHLHVLHAAPCSLHACIFYALSYS
jgi:hypothetical protein